MTADVATTGDVCAAPIGYGVTCYQVATGETWDGDDEDRGSPVVRILCAACYGGPAVGTTPRKVVLR